MKLNTKNIVIATMILLFPAATFAYDGHGTKGTSHSSASKQGYHSKSGHHSIPGTSLSYIRSILKGADRIGLSEKQRNKVGKLLVAAESDAAKAHAEAEVVVAAFRSKLHSGSVSDKEVNAYTKEMGELRAARLAAHLQASVAASRLLSDEQKAKLYGGKGK